MAKPLNVGMVGCGFMGRTHSNAYHRVNQFFDVVYRPVLKALADVERPRAEDFARRWGWQRVETDWRKLVEDPDNSADASVKTYKFVATSPEMPDENRTPTPMQAELRVDMLLPGVTTIRIVSAANEVSAPIAQ